MAATPQNNIRDHYNDLAIVYDERIAYLTDQEGRVPNQSLRIRQQIMILQDELQALRNKVQLLGLA